MSVNTRLTILVAGALFIFVIGFIVPRTASFNGPTGALALAGILLATTYAGVVGYFGEDSANRIGNYGRAYGIAVGMLLLGIIFSFVTEPAYDTFDPVPLIGMFILALLVLMTGMSLWRRIAETQHEH
jgi:hypothetical protein